MGRSLLYGVPLIRPLRGHLPPDRGKALSFAFHPQGPIPPIRGKCRVATKGVGKVARAKPATDEGNAKGLGELELEERSSNASLV